MMEVGSYIKLQRVQQGMTQDELASGIVSMSYLSKIENQRAEASPEVISLLCTRLGIEIDNEKDIDIKDKCEEWYGMLFEVNDKEEIKKRYEELNKLMETVNSNNYLMFEIYKVRYFLVIGEHESALEQINSLNEVSNTFDNLHLYYWYKFKGNYNSLTGDNNQALKLYELAEEKLKQIDLKNDEAADLYYTIAVAHSKIRNTLESIDYAERAIEVFQIEYNFIRCAQCHIVLGISYRRIKMYDKAIKNYNLAKHLGGLERSNQIIQLANVNLGYLYSSKGDSHSAVHYYGEVVEDSEVDLQTKLPTATSLTREYFKIGEYDRSKIMLDKGLKLFKRLNYDEAFKAHYYALTAYKYAMEKDEAKFESILINEFLPYLTKHKEYVYLVDFANMLGEHFEKQAKYKEALKYYKLANLTYGKLIIL
ncbi:helix-turn-helix domain-containing protein [Virgibacillus sp. MSJ-26]|uniref:helix-turn-helix domain-containing protein n=1 Tax=Virgibacillus sp. MSJ-26 TaxID=2841522 RepID=UPI001C127EC7|nr:helix-turn-helix domain-containing protein [Virgibacillus sp. MSJ-26]MBU5467963.1 helix-turn-helix domain-containing protein [Virgibacillus sp. MSJ-26]